MDRIALLCTFVLIASSALAGEGLKDREADRLMQIIRDEIAREDCLWRESLAQLSSQTPDEQQKTAGLVAHVCSQQIVLFRRFRPGGRAGSPHAAAAAIGRT